MTNLTAEAHRRGLSRSDLARIYLDTSLANAELRRLEQETAVKPRRPAAVQRPPIAEDNATAKARAILERLMDEIQYSSFAQDGPDTPTDEEIAQQLSSWVDLLGEAHDFLE
jgi:hypothetical protein